MTGSREPSLDFFTVPLDLHTVLPGERYERIFHARYPDPLGYGKAPSRFSDPRRIIEANRFGVLYFGSSVKVCVVETLIRDGRDGLVGPLLMSESELNQRSCASIEFSANARLVDLRGDGPLRMGIPSDVVRASRHGLARRWSLAFYSHPDDVDGIIYPSRLNDETNVALYDRAIAKLSPIQIRPLKATPGFASVLNDFKVALIR